MPMYCPICGYDLRGVTVAKGVTCSECGRLYSTRDVKVLLATPDNRGEPASLPAHECRVRGRWLVIGFALVVAVVAAACLATMLWTM